MDISLISQQISIIQANYATLKSGLAASIASQNTIGIKSHLKMINDLNKVCNNSFESFKVINQEGLSKQDKFEFTLSSLTNIAQESSLSLKIIKEEEAIKNTIKGEVNKAEEKLNNIVASSQVLTYAGTIPVTFNPKSIADVAKLASETKVVKAEYLKQIQELADMAGNINYPEIPMVGELTSFLSQIDPENNITNITDEIFDI